MKKKIVLIGAGGHAGSCIEVINSQKQFYISELVGIKKNLHIQKKYKVVSEARFIKRKKNKPTKTFGRYWDGFRKNDSSITRNSR